MTIVNIKKAPSVFIGAMLIAGTIVGAGMFSLPVMLAGAWFSWSFIALIFTWFCMFTSGMFLLEANLNYQIGSSFYTVTKDLLGNKWNIVNGLSVAFVLYILTYAYISGGGSVFSHTIYSKTGLQISPKITGFIFTIIVAFIVWLSTTATSRVTAFVLGVKILTFILTFSSLFLNIDLNILFDVVKTPHLDDNSTSYFPFIFIALPYCLTSFGFHGNVPSLMKAYGKDPKRIRRCILFGTLIALFLYLFWIIGTMGNISRSEFGNIIKEGGNMDVFVNALSGVLTNKYTNILLLIFSNFAVASSFLGVSLGLFDYIADLFKLDNSRMGRFKTALITFIPPLLGVLIYTNGFILAIGFAGLAATIWAVIVPALLAKQSRIRFGSPIYRVWGGNKLIALIILFGLINAACHILSQFNLLPFYS